MNKQIVALLLVLVVLGGCSGEAEIILINNTSTYVEGDINGGGDFGLNPNGRATRMVDVGGMWSSSSEVEINVRYHESSSASSPIICRKTFAEEYSAGTVYTFELYTSYE